MKTHAFRICSLLLFLFFSAAVYGQQKEIVIDPDLAANADKYKVKMGTQWMGKIWKIKFGDYAVTDSKNGWVKTTSNEKLFSFKASSSSNQEFSFTLSEKSSDEAIVNAATAISTEELRSLIVFDNFSIGSNELLNSTQSFSAVIYRKSDETNTWVLVKTDSQGSQVPGGFQAFMTNQDRKIDIHPTDSNKNGEDDRQFPALGYEFVENDQVISAMQYFGGGAFGFNKNIVWIRKDLDTGTKLILAAAMTALFQVDITTMVDMD